MEDIIGSSGEDLRNLEGIEVKLYLTSEILIGIDKTIGKVILDNLMKDLF